jgi:glycosyltransferase involved in cell wall biosynthesis
VSTEWKSLSELSGNSGKDDGDVVVSVFVPTHNRRELLARAVDSVLSQDFDGLELIVVDDASTDDTGQYLKSVAAADARVSVITQPSAKGAPAARNRAISIAKGHFVTGLDDDDYFAPDRLSSFMQAWQDLTARGIAPACLYSQTADVRRGETVVSTRAAAVRFEDMFVQNSIGNQIFAPRDHFVAIRMFDESLPAWQDLDLEMRMLKRHGTAYLVDRPTYIYDDEDRMDRISSKADRIRIARSIIARKHGEVSAKLQFALFMQMFNGYYNIKPSLSEIAHAVRSGPAPAHIKQIMKMWIKSHIPARTRFTAA